MGSLSSETGAKPDLVHLANWKRFNDVPWKLEYVPGRYFNYPPSSINDGAVCYYFESRPLPRGGSWTGTVSLAVEDPRGFLSSENSPRINRVPGDSRYQDLRTLGDLVIRLDAYITNGVSVPADELSAMESIITRLKSRYDLR
jgi:hypothetical protein